MGTRMDRTVQEGGDTMDELTRCLYEFVCEKRLGSLSEDQEYIDAVLGAKRVASYLSKEQQPELRALMDAAAAQGDITSEHLFCAALSLARELNKLVRV